MRNDSILASKESAARRGPPRRVFASPCRTRQGGPLRPRTMWSSALSTMPTVVFLAMATTAQLVKPAWSSCLRRGTMICRACCARPGPSKPRSMLPMTNVRFRRPYRAPCHGRGEAVSAQARYEFSLYFLLLREHRVLRALAEGMTNKAIARRLDILRCHDRKFISNPCSGNSGGGPPQTRGLARTLRRGRAMRSITVVTS